MALRYLARAAISTPSALRLAPPGPHVSLSSAGSRPPLASHSSHQQVVGYSNGAWGARKKTDKQTERSIAKEGRVTRQELFETVLVLRARLNKERRRRERFYLGSAALVVTIVVACEVRDQRERRMIIESLLSEIE